MKLKRTVDVKNVIGLLYDCDTNKVVKETDLYFIYHNYQLI